MSLRSRFLPAALLVTCGMLLFSACSKPDPRAEALKALSAPDSAWAKVMRHEAGAHLGDFQRITFNRITARYDPQTRTLTASEQMIFTNRTDGFLDGLTLRTVAALWGPGGQAENFRVISLAVDGRQYSYSMGDTLLHIPVTIWPDRTVTVDLSFETRLPTIYLPETYEEEVSRERRPAETDNAGLYGAGKHIIGLGGFPLIVPDGYRGRQSDGPPEKGLAAHSDVAFTELNLTLPATWSVAHGGAQIAPPEYRKDGTKQVHLAWGPSQEATLFVGEDLTCTGQEVNGLKLTSCYPGNQQIFGRRVLAEAAALLAAEEGYFGPAPFSQITLVGLPIAGHLGGVYLDSGLVALSEIYYSDDAYPMPEDYPEPALRALVEVDLQQERRALIAHELAHIWWGGLTYPAEANEEWQMEALAEATAVHALEAVFGAEAADAQRAGMVARYQAMRAAGLPDAPLNLNPDEYEAESQYETLMYDKGGLFFDRLRQAMGNDLYYQLLRRHLRQYGWTTSPAEAVLTTMLADPTGSTTADPIYRRWVKSASGDEEIGLVHITNPEVLESLKEDHGVD